MTTKENYTKENTMIYELRAYIGVTKTLYMAIYTNMAAAQKEVERLQRVYSSNGIGLFGKITPLQPNGDKYEPVVKLTEYINKQD